MFEPGDDLAALATSAVRDRADALGMAGGDGSQAAVAAVAEQHDVPTSASPPARATTSRSTSASTATTRSPRSTPSSTEKNAESTSGLNGRIFVNNVAMGVYGAVVHSPEYRDHKARTIVAMSPELLGPAAEPFDLSFAGKGGATFDRAALVLVSNNPYVIDPWAGKGTRGDIDGGVLGVIAVTGPPPRGLAEWTTATFVIDSAAPIALGIDGESVVMEPPLLFESSPQTLRVRVPLADPSGRLPPRGLGPSR